MDANPPLELIQRIADFLQAEGFCLQFAAVPQGSFLPGVAIHDGVLLIDPTQLLSPGDILHEAGHLAVLSPSDRSKASGRVGEDGGMEMAAIAWSWAATLHLGIPASVLFHSGGYKGGSAALIENFRAGRYIGVPLLEWLGMAYGEKRAQAMGTPPYPSMIRWLRIEATADQNFT
jgi:hypothetical protein